MLRSRGRLRWLQICWLVFVAWFVYVMAVPVGGSKTVTVLIPQGASAGRISRILAEQGVIRSPLGFRMQVRITGRASKLKPGAYRLSSDMMPLKIIAMMSSGDTYARWITIPEGFTVRRIARRLASEKLVNEDRFLEIALHGGSSFRTGFSHPAGSLEGYLFPDTYLIAPGSSEEAIISDMLKCFQRRAADGLGPGAGAGLNLHQIITLASLIEREARVPKDRALVSAVLRNRLRRGMRLECDATVLYALGEHKERVFYRDLEVDSPYNTYRNAGLPPGPIANPGLACITAAVNPARADYLYYVARPDGSHIFSRTLEEHNRAKQIARREAGR